MKLTCYTIGDRKPNIRPGVLEREWMDESNQKFAYRCLPLNIANTHGWEILSPCQFMAVWNGDDALDAIRIETDGEESLAPISHFGHGILTFHVDGLFRTEPGYNLWVSGPSNSPKEGISPLSGLVETDWVPFTFTMNWKFTRKDHPVFFSKGEPFCSFFPVQRGLLEQIEPEFQPIENDSDTKAAFEQWQQSRKEFNKGLKEEGSESHKLKWQKHYFHGKKFDGSDGCPSHQSKLRLKRFVDVADTKK